MRINNQQKSKIKRFVDDADLSNAVYEVILNSFLKSKPNRDVYQLAASRLAIDLLDEAWRDLDGFKNELDEKLKVGVQVGM